MPDPIYTHSLPPNLPAKGLSGLNFLRYFNLHLRFLEKVLEISKYFMRTPYPLKISWFRVYRGQGFYNVHYSRVGCLFQLHLAEFLDSQIGNKSKSKSNQYHMSMSMLLDQSCPLVPRQIHLFKIDWQISFLSWV